MEFDSETRKIVVAQPSALVAMESAQIDRQVATAKAYPRSESKAIQKAISIATMSQRVAESMGYTLKRRGKDGKDKFITGPSVRCAEVVASTWGHMRVGSRIIEETDTTVVAEGIAWDMESNVCMSATVSRVIVSTDKRTGETRRYSEDMVNTTKQAACALASRNAVFKVIPKALIMEVYEPAMKLAAGDGKTIAQRREAMKQKFKEHDVTERQLCAFCDKAMFDDLDLNDIKTLIGVYNSIGDGEPVDQFFPAEAPKDDPAERTELLTKIGARAKALKMDGTELSALCQKTMKSTLNAMNNAALMSLLNIMDRMPETSSDPAPGQAPESHPNDVPWNEDLAEPEPTPEPTPPPPTEPTGKLGAAWKALVDLIANLGLTEADLKKHCGVTTISEAKFPHLVNLGKLMRVRQEKWLKISELAATKYGIEAGAQLADVVDNVIADWWTVTPETLDSIIGQLSK